MNDPINLRKIIELLLNGKKIIIITTILTLVCSIILSWFVLDEQYESTTVVQISSGVQDAGIMSNYVATEFTPTVYMQRLKNESMMKEVFKRINDEDFVMSNLSVEPQINTNLVNVKYLSDSPEQAQNTLNIVLNETKQLMDKSVKETLYQLEKTYLTESESLSKEIEQLMNSYNNLIISNNLPELLILQTITSSQFVLDLTETQTAALNTIDGKIQNELLQMKAKIDSKSTEFRDVLSKYQAVKTGLDSFEPDPFIRVIIEPTLNEKPTSPNKLINVLLGLIIGVFIGICLVFFREYWKVSSEDLVSK